jgi:hypothetical protein
MSAHPLADHIVNVATVPLRSPFRYLGGKTWLVPRIRQWFASLSAQPAEFIEPAGDFLMTYSDDAVARDLAGRHGFDCRPIAMKNTHNAKMTELLIGRDVGWVG